MDAKAEGRLRGVAEDLHRTSDFGKQTTESIRKAGCSAGRPTQLRSSAQPRTRDDSSALPHGRRALSATAAGPCTGRLRGGGVGRHLVQPSVAVVLGGLCGGLCPAVGMSAEAADREAATSSRPCTPPQTSWFEFVLEEALLEQHLQKPSPGACPAGRRLPAASGSAGPRSPALPGAGSFRGAVRRRCGRLCCDAGEWGAQRGSVYCRR